MSTKAQANSYVQKARRTKVRGKTKMTGKDLKNAALETGKDLVVGAVGGGLVGAVLGRGSLIGGALVSFAGHLKNSRILSAFGLGMMASSGLSKPSEPSVNGTPLEKVEAAKSRMKLFGEGLKQRLWMDKILKSRQSNDESTAGLGEVKYFVYPSGEEVGSVDLSELDSLEQAIQQSASNYQNQFSGELPDELDQERIY